ncbi:MAG TPA: PIN domain-containing protein [Anaerolineales bacterium]|nr:PIN domain-containing protein [Anaerolineales bacterium]
MVIFVDTSALLALINKHDEFHNQAKQQWKVLLENKETLLTNNYVILESISLIQRRFGMDWIQALHTDLLALIEIAWIDENQHQAAINNFLKAGRRHLSLVDCSSFETMQRLEINAAFAFDEHFREQDFEVIP